jgi:hypothetical protein
MKTSTSNALGLRYDSATRNVYQVALSFKNLHIHMLRRNVTSIFTTTTPAARMPLYQCSINDKTLPPTTPSASTTLNFTV